MSSQSDQTCVRNMSLMAGGFFALLFGLIAVASSVA